MQVRETQDTVFQKWNVADCIVVKKEGKEYLGQKLQSLTSFGKPKRPEHFIIKSPHSVSNALGNLRLWDLRKWPKGTSHFTHLSQRA